MWRRKVFGHQKNKFILAQDDVLRHHGTVRDAEKRSVTAPALDERGHGGIFPFLHHEPRAGIRGGKVRQHLRKAVTIRDGEQRKAQASVGVDGLFQKLILARQRLCRRICPAACVRQLRPASGRGQTDGRPAGAPASEPALKSPAEKEKARPQRLRSCRYPPRPKRLAPIPDPYAAPRNIFRSGIYCTVNQN